MQVQLCSALVSYAFVLVLLSSPTLVMKPAPSASPALAHQQRHHLSSTIDCCHAHSSDVLVVLKLPQQVLLDGEQQANRLQHKTPGIYVVLHL